MYSGLLCPEVLPIDGFAYRLIMFIAIIIYKVKALYKVKSSGQHLSFNIFCFTSTCAYNKNKLCKISDI